MDIRNNPANQRLLLLLTLVASAVAMRILPHPPNFTPVAALALFAGAHFSSRSLAFLVPLLAMILSDAIIHALTGFGFHSQAPAVYLSFILIVCIGLWLQPRRRAGLVLGAAVASSVLFFVVSNFGLWLEGSLYPRTAEGLVACFVAAIPFYAWTFAGDLFYTGVLFGLFAYADKHLPRADLQPA